MVATYYSLDPEVPGEFGEDCQYDNTHIPPTLERLHLEFHDWAGDELLECFPCHIVTAPLKTTLESTNLSGIRFEPVKVTRDYVFGELHGDKALPTFHWMKVEGRKEDGADFFIAEDERLTVSQKALDLLKRHCMTQCDVEDYLD